MNLSELERMSNDMIEDFRKLKNSIRKEHYMQKQIDDFIGHFDYIADILHKQFINDDEFADVVWRIDELISVIGVQSYASGFEPIILQHVNSVLK